MIHLKEKILKINVLFIKKYRNSLFFFEDSNKLKVCQKIALDNCFLIKYFFTNYQMTNKQTDRQMDRLTD